MYLFVLLYTWAQNVTHVSEMSTALYFIIWRMIFSIGIQNSWRSWNNAGRNEDECVKTKMTALKSCR